MTDAADIAERYIATWNETDGRRRRDMIARDWTRDATYVDPLVRAAGHEGIDAMIAGVQAKYTGHRFALHGKPEAHNDRVRFSWSFAASGAAPVAHGTDFAIVGADGRLESVTGFFDQH